MYITYKNIGENGRLGNQLFQYASIKGLASKINCVPVLPSGIENRYWHGQKCLLHDLFDLNIKIEDVEVKNTYRINTIKGVNDNNFYNCKGDTNIEGFPESEYYFKHIKDEIKKELNIKESAKKNVINFINSIKNDNKQLIGIHIRRGDTLDCDSNIYICNNIANTDHCTETEWLYNYLNITINKFDINNCKFIIFSGGSRVNSNKSDIEWCEYYFTKYFPELDVYYSKNGKDIDDFIIMTLCDHAILTSLSTFGWWGAYLINNKNKKVYVPKISDKNNYWKTSGSEFWAEEFIIIDH